MRTIRIEIYALVVAFALVGLGSCSGMFPGTSQHILVKTNPRGADCEFIREGTVIARAPETPEGVTIKKTKVDVTVRCTKPGYQNAEYVNHPRVAGAPFGDIALDYGYGWIIDLADYKYDGIVEMTLVPISPGAKEQTAPR